MRKLSTQFFYSMKPIIDDGKNCTNLQTISEMSNYSIGKCLFKEGKLQLKIKLKKQFFQVVALVHKKFN